MDDILANRKDEAKAVIDEIAQSMDISPMDEDRMYKTGGHAHRHARGRQALSARRHRQRVLDRIPRRWASPPCSVFGDVTNCGLPIGCETDVMCAITMSLLMAASPRQGVVPSART